METHKTFHPSDFTRLPSSMHMKSNSSGGVIKVLTPHKGEVVLDWQYDGMFKIHEVLASKMVDDLRELEHESREHLFNEWLSKEKLITK